MLMSPLIDFLIPDFCGTCTCLLRPLELLPIPLMIQFVSIKIGTMF